MLGYDDIILTMFDLTATETLVLEYSVILMFFFGLFSLLAEVFPNVKGQPILRKGMGTDLIYWFLTPLLYAQIAQWILFGITFVFFLDAIKYREFNSHGLGIFASLPIAIQFIISILIMNIVEYWMHRLFHGKILWKIHSIHHSTKELDWLSGVRFHPLNMIAHSVFAGTLVFVLGFSPIVYILRFPFDVIYAAMVHANLNWTFGPLRYIFASPVFHRFHHTGALEGGERNFAPHLSFIDLLFDTFYMPLDRLPANFGVVESVPEGFFAQLIYPFKRTQK